MLAAKLRKIQADLETFALETEDPIANKEQYYDQSREMQSMIERVNPLLK